MRLLAPALLLGMACMACADRGEMSTTGGAVWSLSPEPTLSIGQLDGPEEYLFQQVTGGRLLSDGGVVVSDGGLLEIRVFDGAGTLRSRMGGYGEGPGEFNGLGGVWITPDGSVGAFDPDLNRMQIFSLDGAHRESYTIRGPGTEHTPGSPPMNLDLLVGDFEDGAVAFGSLAFGGSPAEPTIQPDRFLLSYHAGDGEFGGVLGEETFFHRFRGSPVGYSPVPYAATHGDSLYFADSETPRVEVRDRDGNVRRAIQLPVEPVGEDEAYAALADAIAGNEGPNTPERLEAAPRPESIPTVAGLIVDDGGFVWVRQFEVPDDALWLSGGVRRFGGSWWVFDPAGNLAATITLADGVRPLDIRGDRLLALARDDLDVERIVVYTIDR